MSHPKASLAAAGVTFVLQKRQETVRQGSKVAICWLQLVQHRMRISFSAEGLTPIANLQKHNDNIMYITVTNPLHYSGSMLIRVVRGDINFGILTDTLNFLTLREASPSQNGWIFGKAPNGLWPPPSFSENHVADLFKNSWPKYPL